LRPPRMAKASPPAALCQPREVGHPEGLSHTPRVLRRAPFCNPILYSRALRGPSHAY
jgi:hypothetical protein